MKQFITLIALLFAFSVSLVAKESTFRACTADKQAVELTVNIADEASGSVAEHVQAAFTKAAAELTAEELRSYEGFLEFASNLTDEDIAVIVVGAPPAVVDGVCK